MRRRYLLTYDVCDAKRLRKMFKTMKGYGEPLQYSVFVCDLSRSEYLMMKHDVGRTLNHAEDRVMIVDLGRLGTSADRRIEFIGRAPDLPPTDGEAVIV